MQINTNIVYGYLVNSKIWNKLQLWIVTECARKLSLWMRRNLFCKIKLVSLYLRRYFWVKILRDCALKSKSRILIYTLFYLEIHPKMKRERDELPIIQSLLMTCSHVKWWNILGNKNSEVPPLCLITHVKMSFLTWKSFMYTHHITFSPIHNLTIR